MSGLLILRFLFRRPSFLFPFVAVYSMWVFVVVLSAIVTLRYFVFAGLDLLREVIDGIDKDKEHDWA